MTTTHAVEPTYFRYERRDFAGGKAIVRLAHTDLATFAVQVVRSGGETNLHAHPSLDGFWFVLSGRARFYTTESELVAEIGRFEGVLIPRGLPYWFESAGEEELEILQLEASSVPKPALRDFAADRIDLRPRQAKQVAIIADQP